jgi:hypothetical protein
LSQPASTLPPLPHGHVAFEPKQNVVSGATHER